MWRSRLTAAWNVVLVGLDGAHSLIRRAETVETMVQQEEMPAWLA